ncbi:MAG: hypothetical protein VYD54_02075, partial [Bdellovibrionota bacterium]|nr:hypothetical protein [Bdellovibrionota bacterium]
LNGLSLLFFHLKKGSKQKNDLVKSFNGIFGENEDNFLSFKGGFPEKVTIPDRENERGRVLEISYVPLFNNDSKVEKLMLIVDDITEVEQELLESKEDQLKYSIFMEILPLKKDEKFCDILSDSIKHAIFVLERWVGPESSYWSVEDYQRHLYEITAPLNQDIFKKMTNFWKTITRLKREIEAPKITETLEIRVVEVVSFLIETLIKYADAINLFHEHHFGPQVKYRLPQNFEQSLVEKIDDLEGVMSNLMGYVFLVRKISDLDEEKIANAPQKARLYSEFDSTINLIMTRAKLISFLLKVFGKAQLSEQYNNFSNLLRQMPSKDKLTQDALVNHLIGPYKNLVG